MKRFQEKTYRHGAMWAGAILVGLGAVLYARLISVLQHLYYRGFSSHPYWISLLAPLAFLMAAAMVKRLAPEAKGSGIPQVLEAIHLEATTQRENETRIRSLVSIRTAVVKVFSSSIGILAGASIGREGPTVQIAASGFAWVGRRLKNLIPHFNPQTYLVAGAAAGVSAAFNTPLAGITFALEEIAEGAFGLSKDSVILAVVLAGITAQAILGDYLYFGHPVIVTPAFHLLLSETLILGGLGGVFGGAFAQLLAYPKFIRIPKNTWVRALVCGVICSAIGLATNGNTAGSGYEVTQQALSSNSTDGVNILFPLLKFITTVLSYLSGMAGGIFSPSLSIGAGLGLSVAKLLHFENYRGCALIGMVGFFSAVVQAPLTAVVIVMEMTDQHVLVIPFMAAAFIANSIGRRFMPVPLYRFMATQYDQKT